MLKPAKETEFQFDFNNAPIKTHSYGVGTARFNALLQLNEKQILVPINLNLCVYDLYSMERVQMFQYNSNAIFVLIENEKYIFSIAFSGEIAIIEKQSLKLVKILQTTGREVRYADVNETHLSLSCEYYKQNTIGSLEVYDIKDIEKTNKIIETEGKYEYCMLNLENCVICAEKNIITQEQQEGQENKFNHNFVKFDLNSKQIINKLHHLFVGEIIYAGRENNIACYLYSKRFILLLDLSQNSNDKPLYFGNIEGSGSILSCTVQNGYIYFSPNSNNLAKLKIPEKQGELPEIIETKKIGQIHPLVEIIEAKSSAFTIRNFHLKWNKIDKELYVFNEDGLILYSMEQKKELARNQHANITCVGLASSPDEKLLAVGDMIGNIYIYPIERNLKGDIQKQVWIMGAIRCLAWSPCGKFIFAGCMDGNIYRWELQAEGIEPELITNLDSTITSIRPKQNSQQQQQQQQVQYLVTNTNGYVNIFQDFESKVDIKPHITFLAHKPVPKEQNKNPDRFGSLHIKAEIWNSIWSCNNDQFIATCSEDQTGHIFDLKQQNNQIHNLTGQNLAVTCVDWQNMGQGLGEVYVQCSDDKTVRIYNPANNFEFLYEIQTYFVHEWHTLTYLALQKNGTKVAIGGQSGYLFVFDLALKKWIYAEKVHLGGIEGLVWEKEYLITCSSDCCVNIIEI